MFYDPSVYASRQFEYPLYEYRNDVKDALDELHPEYTYEKLEGLMMLFARKIKNAWYESIPVSTLAKSL